MDAVRAVTANRAGFVARSADCGANRHTLRRQRVAQRSERNAARISIVKTFGCSQAAKWPPRSSLL